MSDQSRIIAELHREMEQTNRGLIALHTELEAAREAEARLAAIVRASDDAIFSASRDGLIQTWNPGAERLLGHTDAHIVGRPISCLVAVEHLPAFEVVLAQVLAGAHPGSYDSRCRRHDGSLIDVSVTLSAMFDTDGAILGVSAVLRDITERLRAATELATARAEQQIANERDRIARSLSQAVIKQLFATEMKLAGAADLVTNRVAHARIAESIREIDETINRIRDTIFRDTGAPIAADEHRRD